MIKALWFMTKIALVVTLCVWIAERPGTVSVEWMEYEFHFQFGFFLLLGLIALLCALFLHGIIRGLLDLPKNITKHRQKKRTEKGYIALTRGLTAVAAGDQKTAQQQANRASTLLSSEHGLPLLLEAQAARMDGREEDAEEHFIKLTQHKDTAFLGVRGLLQSALDQGQHDRALELARDAHDLNPKQPWIIKIRYDLEVKSHAWIDARKTLKRAEKTKAFPADKIKSDRVVIYLASAEDHAQNGETEQAFEDIKKAYKLAPDFVPASCAMARAYLDQNKRSRAVQILERAWKAGAHPDILTLWGQAMPGRKAKNVLARLKWYERLLAINPQSVQALQAVAEAAIKDGLWGEARSYLDQAENIRPTSQLYTLRAALEEKSGSGDEATTQAYLNKAQNTEAEPVWVCTETGRIYDRWSPIANPHGAFNSIIWDIPQNWLLSETLISGAGAQNISILEAPKN